MLSRAALLAVAGVSAAPEDYFVGRSADVVFKPSGDDAHAFFLDQSGIIHPNDQSSIDTQNVAGVVTRGLGVMPTNSNSAASFLQTSFFHRPRADLVVSLDSVGLETLKEHGEYLPNLRSLGGSTPALDGTVQSLKLNTRGAGNSVGTLANIATGQLAAEHGIVASSWKGSAGAVRAYSSPTTAASTANMADVLSQSFDGQSLVVSLSADEQQASAFCLHPNLAASNPQWNSVCATSVPSAEALMATFAAGGPDSVLAALAAADAALSLQYADGVVSVASASLDLAAAPVRALLGELQGFHRELRALSTESKTQRLVQDDAPDLFVLAASAMPQLKAAYGDAGEETLAALRLIDSAVGLYYTTLSALYDQHFTSQVLLLGSSPSSSEAASLLQTLQSVLPASQQAEAAQYFPRLYASDGQADQLCQTLSAVKAGSFSVQCNLVGPRRALKSTSSLNNVGQSGNVTLDDIGRYQIQVWLSIGLAFIMIATIYSLAYMDFKKDTLLYSTFNPKWEDRKVK